jgi:hypothetical protein
MFYFGTNGSRDYVPIPVREGDILPLYQEHDSWEKLERTLSDYTMKKVTFSRGYFLGTEWTLYLKPWSVDDGRCGSFTSLFWEGEHTIEEIEAFIKKTPFLQRQFSKPIDTNRFLDGEPGWHLKKPHLHGGGAYHEI